MILSVENLQVSYGPTKIIQDVSLEVSPSGPVGLVGPNGAGKTTTLRAISRVVGSQGGRIKLDGSPLPASAHRVARMGVAHVPEGRGLFPKLTVRENLQYACYAVGQRFSDVTVRAAVEEYFPAVAELYHRKAGHLSGGEQQMVAILRGLVVKPSVLLVDELSLGLSPKVADIALRGLIAACARQGLALLLVDEDVSRVRAVCERVYALANGRSREISHQTREEDQKTYLS